MPKGRAKGWKPADHGKDPGGRPPYWTDDRLDKLGDELVEWAQEESSHFLETFCKNHAKHRVYPQRLSEWAANNEKFAESLKTAKACLAANMAEATFDGGCPPAFGIFGLKQHGWTDRQELSHSGEIGGSIVVEVQLPAKAGKWSDK